MNIVPRLQRKILSPKEAADALFAKRSATATEAPRILEDAPKPVIVETRKSRGLAAKAVRVAPKIIDHAVVALAAMPSAEEGGDDNFSYRRINTVSMPLAEWVAVPKNPRQRDEIVRIEKNRATHLMVFEPKHAEVAMAVLPNGERYKVDGHTRTAVWQLGLAKAPSTLTVDVYACADIAAAQLLYDHFDNTAAMESGTDRVTGAYRQAGISPNCAMLKAGEISTAIRQLYYYIHRTSPKKHMKNIVINEGVLLFAKEIELLDKVSPTRALFPTGILMGALLTFAYEPKNATTFWSEYAQGGGNKVDGRMDAVQALHERRMKDRKKGNSVKDSALMATSIAAVGGYKRGATYTVEHGITAKTKDMVRKYANDAMALKGGK